MSKTSENLNPPNTSNSPETSKGESYLSRINNQVVEMEKNVSQIQKVLTNNAAERNRSNAETSDQTLSYGQADSTVRFIPVENTEQLPPPQVISEDELTAQPSQERGQSNRGEYLNLFRKLFDKKDFNDPRYRLAHEMETNDRQHEYYSNYYGVLVLSKNILEINKDSDFFKEKYMLKEGSISVINGVMDTDKVNKKLEDLKHLMGCHWAFRQIGELNIEKLKLALDSIDTISNISEYINQYSDVLPYIKDYDELVGMKAYLTQIKIVFDQFQSTGANGNSLDELKEAYREMCLINDGNIKEQIETEDILKRLNAIISVFLQNGRPNSTDPVTVHENFKKFTEVFPNLISSFGNKLNDAFFKKVLEVVDSDEKKFYQLYHHALTVLRPYFHGNVYPHSIINEFREKYKEIMDGVFLGSSSTFTEAEYNRLVAEIDNLHISLRNAIDKDFIEKHNEIKNSEINKINETPQTKAMLSQLAESYGNLIGKSKILNIPNDVLASMKSFTALNTLYKKNGGAFEIADLRDAVDLTRKASIEIIDYELSIFKEEMDIFVVDAKAKQKMESELEVSVLSNEAFKNAIGGKVFDISNEEHKIIFNDYLVAAYKDRIEKKSVESLNRELEYFNSMFEKIDGSNVNWLSYRQKIDDLIQIALQNKSFLPDDFAFDLDANPKDLSMDNRKDVMKFCSSLTEVKEKMKIAVDYIKKYNELDPELVSLIAFYKNVKSKSTSTMDSLVKSILLSFNNNVKNVDDLSLKSLIILPTNLPTAHDISKLDSLSSTIQNSKNKLNTHLNQSEQVLEARKLKAELANPLLSAAEVVTLNANLSGMSQESILPENEKLMAQLNTFKEDIKLISNELTAVRNDVINGSTNDKYDESKINLESLINSCSSFITNNVYSSKLTLGSSEYYIMDGIVGEMVNFLRKEYAKLEADFLENYSVLKSNDVFFYEVVNKKKWGEEVSKKEEDKSTKTLRKALIKGELESFFSGYRKLAASWISSSGGRYIEDQKLLTDAVFEARLESRGFSSESDAYLKEGKFDFSDISKDGMSVKELMAKILGHSPALPIVGGLIGGAPGAFVGSMASGFAAEWAYKSREKSSDRRDMMSPLILDRDKFNAEYEIEQLSTLLESGNFAGVQDIYDDNSAINRIANHPLLQRWNALRALSVLYGEKLENMPNFRSFYDKMKNFFRDKDMAAEGIDVDNRNFESYKTAISKLVDDSGFDLRNAVLNRYRTTVSDRAVAASYIGVSAAVLNGVSWITSGLLSLLPAGASAALGLKKRGKKK